jgi:hypothetical protein
MKFLGQKKKGECYCSYCTGDNSSKAIHKKLRHRGRRENRKEIDNELADVRLQSNEGRGKKAI